MFAAARDPLLSHRVVEGSGITHDLLNSFAVTAAAQRIVRAVVERNVEDRTKIQIESENAQQTSSDIPMSADKIDIVLVAQLLRVRRFASDQSQARYAPTLLIDGDDRFRFAQIAQVIDQFAQLGRAFDVAPEKNEPARLHTPEQFGAGGIEFLSGNAAEYQLTERITLHGSYAG